MTVTPVLVQPVTPQLTAGYLTPDQFRAFPTWLDLDNLVPGGVEALQDDELADVLLTASRWADNVCENMRLSAHYVQGENQVTRVSGAGRAYLRPRDIPLRAITAISFGWDPAAMTADALPDSSMWVEDGRRVSFRPGGSSGTTFTGPAVQFGARFAPEARVYVSWSYVAGYPVTTMQAVTQGATSVTLADPTGVLPGDVLRIYDIGFTEALTVAATYVPQNPTVPPTPTAVPLAAGTQFAHDNGTGVTGMPRDILQAVICYTIALLMREDVSAEEPQSAFGPAARTSGSGGRGGIAGGLINDAEVLLAPYRPVFRS